MQLKRRHGYLAITERVLIQNPGEEYQWCDLTVRDVSLTNSQLVLRRTGGAVKGQICQFVQEINF